MAVPYPTASQLRVEYDRRKRPVRQYTPCQSVEHRISQVALRITSLSGIEDMIRTLQIRSDVPSHLVDPCSCGGGVPTSKWG